MEYSELLNIFASNDSVLSRTELSKKIDNSSSPAKKANDADQAEVARLLTENRCAAAKYVVWRGKTEMLSSFELRLTLIALAEIVNRGISKNGILRTWPIVEREYGGESEVAPGMISAHLLNLEILDAAKARGKSIEDKLVIIADMEWQIGIGPLHPFADACGRTSRYFSALLSLVYECPVVLHKSRDEYYMHGARGRKAFTSYYQQLARVGSTSPGNPPHF